VQGEQSPGLTHTAACGVTSSKQQGQGVQSPGLALDVACVTGSEHLVHCVQSPGLAPVTACVASKQSRQSRQYMQSPEHAPELKTSWLHDARTMPSQRDSASAILPQHHNNHNVRMRPSLHHIADAEIIQPHSASVNAMHPQFGTRWKRVRILPDLFDRS
jgi:rhamnose utilization protein RhaD (predicted bifunctional aldolase and dehydrogenase)